MKNSFYELISRLNTTEEKKSQAWRCINRNFQRSWKLIPIQKSTHRCLLIIAKTCVTKISFGLKTVEILNNRILLIIKKKQVFKSWKDMGQNLYRYLYLKTSKNAVSLIISYVFSWTKSENKFCPGRTELWPK
jgi:hypothetical protein